MRNKQRTVRFRRKREGKTNYGKRLNLLLSNKPRVVVRRSLKNIIVQIIEYKESGDNVIVSVSSKELEKKYGWKTSKGNVPSAYLIGLLAGKKAVEKGLKEAVLDTGFITSTKGSRVYAVLKGIVDGGLNVPHSKGILPSDDALKGSNIAKYALELKEKDKERYEKIFANYIRNNKMPEELPKYFEEIKSKIGGK